MVIMIGLLLWGLFAYGMLLWFRAATMKGDGDEGRTDNETEQEDSGDKHSEHKPTP